MTVTAKQRYSQLEERRRPFLERARECAKLTIPMLLPEEGDSEHTAYDTPNQSIGSRGVNTLASKLMLALFPPTGSYFKMTVAPEVLAKLPEEVQEAVEEALVMSEQAIMSDFEAHPITAPMTEALKHLINEGNILLYYDPKTALLSMYRLDSYVCRRDGEGTVMEIITVEKMAPSTLSFASQEVIRKTNPGLIDKDEDVEVYTYAKRVGKTWRVHQELMGERIEGSESQYPVNKFPYMALRWNYVDSRDYGRGLIEEYFGDLKKLDDLSGALADGTMAAAKLLLLVNPNGVTDEDDITNAENLDVIIGRAEDVSSLQADKFADFSIAEKMIARLEDRLAYAFLLNTAIQRNGDRVTAEEIRIMASELQDALGGVYTLLASELQLPLVRLQMQRAQRMGLLPALPEKSVQPAIVTGIAALGRGHELQKLDAFVAGVQQLLGPEAVERYVKVPNYLTRRANNSGIPAGEIVKTQQEVAQEDAQNRELAMAQQERMMAGQAEANAAEKLATQE